MQYVRTACRLRVAIELMSMVIALGRISIKLPLHFILFVGFRESGLRKCFRIRLNSDLLPEVADASLKSHQCEYRPQSRKGRAV